MTAERTADTDMADIGAVLRELRGMTAYSANQASELLGYGKSTVAMWERGDRTITVDNLVRLARLYDVDPGLALDLMAIRCGRARAASADAVSFFAT